VRTRGAWSHPLRTRGAWALPSAHVALGLCLWVGHSPAHTWCLGCVGLGTSGAWVMAKDSREMDLVSGPKGNRSSIRTQFYWVLHQDSMFMVPTILNVIISFRNIIIFIIINIINKIINKFERKYYYLYYNFYGI
jgi:hypothetical protein